MRSITLPFSADTVDNLVFKSIRDANINSSWCQPCHLLMAEGEAQTAVLHNPSISETSGKAVSSSSAIT